MTNTMVSIQIAKTARDSKDSDLEDEMSPINKNKHPINLTPLKMKKPICGAIYELRELHNITDAGVWPTLSASCLRTQLRSFPKEMNAMQLT